MLDNLTGLYNVEYSIEGDGSGSVANPEYLITKPDLIAREKCIMYEEMYVVI